MGNKRATKLKILFIAGNARSLLANRGDLINEIISQGHQVGALIPKYDFFTEISSLDIPYELINLRRLSMNPWDDLRCFGELIRKIKVLRPDILFSYTLKPVIYGSIAAKIAGVQRIASMITGLGYLFSGGSLKQKSGRLLAELMYHVALRLNDVIFFQNPDDLKLFRKKRIVGRKQIPVLVNGSGVNLEHFRYTPLPNGKPRFLLIARLVEDKGIAEFVAAASRIKTDYPLVSFKVLGPHDPNLPRAIPYGKIQAWKRKGFVKFLPGVKDVRPYLTKCSVLVLPSSYREGTPRTLLEAMAMGRPVITTDAPGCRETVKHGKNGILVKIGSIDDIEGAMRWFIHNAEKIKEMGKESRKIAELKYDVKKVNRIIIEHLLKDSKGGF